MSLKDKIELAGRVLAGGLGIGLITGFPAHFVRNSFVATVEDKTYTSGSRNTSSGGRISVLGESNVRKMLYLDNSLLEWQWDATKEYDKINQQGKYCFRTYGLESATDNNIAPYLFGLHITKVEPVNNCK